jgi:hypothetical protein
MPQSKLYPTDYTLAGGVRVTTITVTTSPATLDTLLDAAVAGRSSLAGRRVLKLRNTHGSNPVYILESASQSITSGWNIESGQTESFEASETFTGNLFTDCGFYLACNSGTISVKVWELR